MVRMKYYFDTSVWMAYFNENEPYHKEALLWFDKIRNGEHELYVSRVLDGEMERSQHYQKYLSLSRSFCKMTTLKEADFQKEIEYLKMKGFGSGDIKQIIICKVNNLNAVTIDIDDWPKIARELNYFVYYIADIYLL